MFGALTKTWYAEQNNLDPKDIVVVSVMPCTAKKDEKEREQMQKDGIKASDLRLYVYLQFHFKL